MPQSYHLKLPFKTLILFCIVSLYSLSLYSQIPGQITSSDTTEVKTTKKIEVIPLSNIGTETEHVISIIREIRNAIKPTKSELVLDSLIPIKLQDIEKMKSDIDLDEIEQMKLRQTETIKNDFGQMRLQLDGWRKEYTSRIDDINSNKSELTDLKTQWEKTKNQEREESLPELVAERIDKNLTEINTLSKELTERNNELLTKQDELTSALIFIDEVLNTVSKTELSYRKQIFTIDSPPMWHIFGNREDTLTFSNRIEKIIEVHNTDLKYFTENYKGSIYTHILFFVILLFLSYYLKADVMKWTDEKKDEVVKYSLHVISRPFSASLLVTLLAAGLFYDETPGDVLNFFYILLAWPILTLLPGLLNQIEKKYYYFMGAIFVFTQIADYFSELVIIDRLLLLILDIGTIIILTSFLRTKEKLLKANPNVNWSFTFTLMKMSIFFLSISIIANTLGNTFLSKILSRGSLTMIYGGIIIYASALILRSLFSLLIQHESIAKLNMIQNYSEEVKHQVFRIIRYGSVIYWIYITLSSYLIYDPIYTWFEDFLVHEWQVGSVSMSIGAILAFFITLWLSLTLSKFIRFILQDEILTHFEMPRGVPGAISMIVRLVLIVIGFILAFGAAKIDLDNIAIIFGALGVGIGFGLQNIFNNLVSGLILTFERPIQVGDIIQIGNLDLMGEVKEIGIRASTVRTFDGAEVIVPNGNLISNEMINWTLSDHRRRQEIIVGVAYGTNTDKVMEILNKIVPEQDNVLKNPPPSIFFLGFGESSLDFRILFWTHFSNGLGTKSAVGIAIDEAFKKEGIEIPFPQRDLHLRSVNDKIDFQKEKKTTRSSGTKAKTSGTSTQTKK